MSALQEEESKYYELTPSYKKSTYQTEQWNHILSNGKKVRYDVTNYFRWGAFEVELTDTEKDEILKSKDIIVNNWPGAICEELWGSSDYFEELVNKEKYTPEEIKEIHKLLYQDLDAVDDYETDCEDMIDEELLDKNGWSMDDTIYGIVGGCKLERI